MRKLLTVSIAVLLSCSGTASAYLMHQSGNRSRQLRVNSRVSYTPAHVVLRTSATLTASGVGGPGSFDSVAASQQTIAATTTDLNDTGLQPDVLAFGKPSAGWAAASSPAILTAADGHRLGAIAASDQAVVAGDASQGNAGPVTALVFTRPATGWHGAESQAATLIAPTNGSGLRAGPLVAMSGESVFISDGDSVYVFDEPQSGWTGTPPVSATLVTTSHQFIASLAVWGNTLVARTGSLLDVFTKPTGAWAGTVAPNATVALPQPVAQDGAVAAAGPTIMTTGTSGSIDIIQRPRRGWSAHQPPNIATLEFPFDETWLGPAITVSGPTAIIGTATPEQHECLPCTARVYGISQPGVWSGTTSLAVSATFSAAGGPTSGAFAGSDLALPTQDGIQLYTTSQPASITAQASDLLSTTPHLSITARQPRGGMPLTGLVLRLPGSLRLNARERANIKLTGAAARRLQITHNTLTITLTRPAATFTLALEDGAAAETPSLARQLTQLTRARDGTDRSVSLTLRAEILGSDRGRTPGNLTITAT